MGYGRFSKFHFFFFSLRNTCSVSTPYFGHNNEDNPRFPQFICLCLPESFNFSKPSFLIAKLKILRSVLGRDLLPFDIQCKQPITTFLFKYHVLSEDSSPQRSRSWN